MGCAASKLEELDAVALCSSRSDLIAEAIRHRYSLADAHAAYAESLRSVGVALHRVLDFEHEDQLQRSPFISLPAQRKGDPILPSSPASAAIPSAHCHSRSQSGSHIQFRSSNDSDSDLDSPLHSSSDSSVRLHPGFDELAGEPTNFNFHYARNNPPPPSVILEHQVVTPEQVRYGSVVVPSSFCSHPSSFPYAFHPNYPGYAGMGGFGCPSPSDAISQPPLVHFEANSEAPPPPSPPRTFVWDLFNPFESYQSYNPTYTSSRSSEALRIDEDKPELEEDKRALKEAFGDHDFVASTSTVPEYSNKSSSIGEVSGSSVESSRHDPRSKEGEVEQNVVVGKVQKSHEERSSAVTPSRRYHNLTEAAAEIGLQFDRAAESTKELARFLEVGKHPYIRKSYVHSVSSRMMCIIPVSMSKGDDLDYEEDKSMSTGNLSSTFQKLYIWEQKLHDEVRVGEKIRLLHDRNKKRLQLLDERGAEAHKIDATEIFIRKLSIKMKIALQIVDSITTKINVLRDEELRPQIEELIQGFKRMWRAMLECHQIQSQTINEANHLDSIASSGKVSDELMNAVIHLEMELMRWIGSFSVWIISQKNFVKALNSWLVLCLHYEPEVTTDGISSYSPERIGAPPVFIILNSWSQALNVLSEMELMAAFQSTVAILNQTWQLNDQNMITSMETKLQKSREREVQMINREAEALKKKLPLVSNQYDLPPSNSTEPSGLHSAMRRLFQSMETFATDAMKAYEGTFTEEVNGITGVKI